MIEKTVLEWILDYLAPLIGRQRAGVVIIVCVASDCAVQRHVLGGGTGHSQETGDLAQNRNM